jgi:hypothetical protein
MFGYRLPALALVLLVPSLALSGCGGSGPSDTEQVASIAKAELVAQAKGDGQAACAQMADTMRRRISRGASTHGHQLSCAEDISGALGVRGPNGVERDVAAANQDKVAKAIVHGDHAKVEMRTRMTHGTGQATMWLERVGDRWLIYRLFSIG